MAEPLAAASIERGLRAKACLWSIMRNPASGLHKGPKTSQPPQRAGSGSSLLSVPMAAVRRSAAFGCSAVGRRVRRRGLSGQRAFLCPPRLSPCLRRLSERLLLDAWFRIVTGITVSPWKRAARDRRRLIVAAGGQGGTASASRSEVAAAALGTQAESCLRGLGLRHVEAHEIAFRVVQLEGSVSPGQKLGGHGRRAAPSVA